MKAAWLLVAVAGLAGAGGAEASVYKCRGADGALTYQQLPCATQAETLANDLATEYPAPNVIERERLLLREAEMYKRLEAQRDRLSAEAVARISRPEPIVIATEPAYPIAWPARLAPRPLRRAPMHGWASERKF
jgi:uncharacterized protein DUF4124